ncbi:SDR family oxidoreductase [Sulfidibacter corallicola]|uniref:SDR family oxidoreductase n=1 Tax=Sulfidibacter corallicola TaxID=2818388 RepID=A0A8A4TQF8_SULCO|nr:SDR family oxidoreductase [Sulfidibacter corallicola]QTD52199.1 SDR family oxidoreductase [Sulfidibacter corallicola]
MEQTRIVMVNGISNPLGAVIVDHFRRCGSTVLGLTDASDERAADVDEVFAVDTTDEKQLGKVFGTVRKTHKRLDVLVNLRGVAPMNLTRLLTRPVLDQAMQTNFANTFFTCQAALSLLKKSGAGRILNTTTLQVPMASMGTAAYSGTRAAVEQFTRVLARETASMNITVNALGLTFVALDGAADDSAADEVVAKTILQRRVTPAELCHAVDFLTAATAGGLTGQVVYLGGV